MKKICFLCLLSIFYVSKIQSNLVASVIQDSIITNIIETVEEPQPILSGKVSSKGNGSSLLEVKNKPELNSDLEDLIIDVPLDLDLYSDNLNYLYPYNRINFEYDYEYNMLFSFDMRDESFQNDDKDDFAFSEEGLNLQDMDVSVLDILLIKDSEMPKIEGSVVLSSLLDTEDSTSLPIPEIAGSVMLPEILIEIEGLAILPKLKPILPITTKLIHVNSKLIHANPDSELSKIASKIRKMVPSIQSNPYSNLDYKDIMKLDTDNYDNSSHAFDVINENLKTYTQRDKLISYFDTYVDLAELHIFLDPLEDKDVAFLVDIHKGLGKLNLFPTHEIKTRFATNDQNQVFAEFILADVDCEVDHALKTGGSIAYDTCIDGPSSQQINANRKEKLAEINKILNENAKKRAEKSN